MAKRDIKTYVHICGYEKRSANRPSGLCPQCGTYITDESIRVVSDAPEGEKISTGLKTRSTGSIETRASSINEIKGTVLERFQTGIEELDRVLGGGFVTGEVVLLSGFPGSGKSTLSLRIAEEFAKRSGTVLYSSGEESVQQIGMRAMRMNVDNDNIKVINETNLSTLHAHIMEEKPKFIVVDSLQTIASDDVNSSIGSIAQSKEAAHFLTALAKKHDITMVLISQVSKSGDFSGSEAIQHIVDCTLMLESDSNSPLKFLRAKKNRFGDTSEVGIFQHSDEGLTEVSDPSGILIDEDEDAIQGVSRTFISEGVRQIPVEIHSLVTSEAFFTNPRITFEGADYGRGQMIIAAMNKYCNLRLQDHDVFVGTVSGLKVHDPMSDLAIAAAIMSSLKDIKSKNRTAYVGEVTLTGQIRGSFMMEQKIKEAERLGFDRIIIPDTSYKSIDLKKFQKIKIIGIKNIYELKSKIV